MNPIAESQAVQMSLPRINGMGHDYLSCPERIALFKLLMDLRVAVNKMKSLVAKTAYQQQQLRILCSEVEVMAQKRIELYRILVNTELFKSIDIQYTLNEPRSKFLYIESVLEFVEYLDLMRW